MNYIDLSSNLNCTDQQISGGRILTVAQIEARFEAALHEAAHLVASTACPGSYVTRVTIANSTRKNSGKGTFEGCEAYPDHESFVSLVGYAWEQAYGDDNFAVGDYDRGFNPRHPYVLDDARAFVKANTQLIMEVSVAILLLIPNHGRLEGKRLAGLASQLRDTWVTPYVSGYVTGKLDHAEPW